MIMNIPGLTTQTLQKFHALIADCLAKDDAQTTGDKEYGVRTFSDWKQLRDDIEAELRKRGISFTPITW
jgi:hypothetical protein